MIQSAPVHSRPLRSAQGRSKKIPIRDGLERIVGVEVKASATVSEGDFAGLRHLAAATGDSFTFGLSYTTTNMPYHSGSAWPPRRYRPYGDDAGLSGFRQRLGSPARPLG